MGEIPIIRLELQRMQHTVCTALQEYAAKLDEDIRAAVEAYCTPQNIQRVVSAAVTAALDAAIKEEVTSFYRYGEGRKHVAEAVKKRLMERDTFTPLDAV